MKKIEILGGGCRNCEVLADETKKAAKEMGVEIELEKITDFAKIARYGVMTTPALVVDGVVKFSGKVLKAEQIKGYL